MTLRSNYDKFPVVPISASPSGCLVGWSAIIDAIIVAINERLRGVSQNARTVLCVEYYPGVFDGPVEQALATGLCPSLAVRTSDLFKNPCEVDAMVAQYLGDDPVFGRMNGIVVDDFFDPQKLAAARESIAKSRGLVLVAGTGAALVVSEADVLIFADMARWEIQMRYRRNQIGNLGANNASASAAEKYKRAYFVDWRAADRLKQKVFSEIDFLLDTNDPNTPKMISGDALREGLCIAAHRPFRVVPYFDPGPWGGHWMEKVCGLSPEGVPNHAWCFDCVPEENSMLLGFGSVKVEIPSINLVFQHPRELLGEAVHARFGKEFPIRFDFLDTMGGGNLSLQVHPLTEYIQDKFGMNYTQDESYYLLDAGDDGCVYLGLREDINGEAMLRDLRAAQSGGPPFPAESYINVWPAKKHDHFLLPAGSIHCSGKNSMVLEISSTPYIFTFKLWDWGRLGLNGLPRPIHLDHGEANIQWDRTTNWVHRNLVNQITPLGSGEGWREERTGLHEREFIETRRHWFTGAVPHRGTGGVNVLNLVEGREAVVESPTGAFEPFVVHYAETFIVPAAAGDYIIRPFGEAEGKECGTIKAFVRTNP
ncbi:MAG TPA: class I mannose-6-phosphate isomerase [Terriglobales bacterium]|nr:class I mannose-6-phosphate isomerase [Terriglobales bacterium]